MTPHIRQQSGDSGNSCILEVVHVGYDSNGNVRYTQGWGPETTTGPSTPVDGPNWYYGPWNGNGHMCVDITVGDYNLDTGHGNQMDVCS